MAYVYTAWPTLANLKALLLGAHVDTTDSTNWLLSDEYLTGVLDARAEQLRIETGRQFVAGSAGEVRYFDGSGTGFQRIDEYVDVSAVEFFYVPGTSWVTANFYEVDQKPWGKDKIQILQGQANMNYAFYQRFPEGRANIKVTAQWGYGATIPANVFMAVLQASAADAMMANTLSAQGQTLEYVDGDARERWSDDPIGLSAGWIGPGSLWEQVKKDYKRSLKSHLQKSRAKLL